MICHLQLSDNMILDRKYGKLLLELEKLMREQEEHRAYNRKQKEQYKRLVVKYQIMLQKHFAICPRCKAIAAGVPLLENKYDVCPVMGS